MVYSEGGVPLSSGLASASRASGGGGGVVVVVVVEVVGIELEAKLKWPM